MILFALYVKIFTSFLANNGSEGEPSGDSVAAEQKQFGKLEVPQKGRHHRCCNGQRWPISWNDGGKARSRKHNPHWTANLLLQKHTRRPHRWLLRSGTGAPQNQSTVRRIKPNESHHWENCETVERSPTAVLPVDSLRVGESVGRVSQSLQASGSVRSEPVNVGH
jgi:hypothetical protein